ncbi:MAG: hypothetical protein CUN55_14480, partial [Phototrophicales bacterium]
MVKPQASIRSTASRRRNASFVIAFLVVVLLLICGLTLVLIRGTISGTRREPKPVLAGVIVETFVELPGKRAYPDSITIGPDGNLYVSSYCEGDIWRITPDGQLDVYFDGDDGIGAASGLAFAPDGMLYVIDGGDCSPRKWSATLKRIAPETKTVERVTNIGTEDLPNALAFDADGNLYVSDSRTGAIRRLEGENFITWWDAPSRDASLTGLAYDFVNNGLVTADTENGILYRVPIMPDGTAGNPQVLVDNTDIELDGLTVDDRGRVFFTQYNLNQVAMYQPESGVTILAKDFRQPSDIAYLN